MSKLDLQEFHSFLEELIEASTRDGRFSVDRTVNSVVTLHPERLSKIQDYLNVLGLRTLIRNNCRSKKGNASVGLDMFGHYSLGKRIPVPYRDDRGKLRWDKKRPNELSFDELDEILARWTDRPTQRSRERRDYDDIARRTLPYRNKARNIGEALEMALKDGQ